MEVHADRVDFDLRSRALEASGNVRVESSPFFLRSEHVKLSRSALGVVVEGEGRLLFCPCLGTPLALSFDGATVAPPYDVIVRKPRLEVFGVPVLWAPVMWLRSPGKLGLLPPELAYRGQDGFFVGEGLHVPWTDGDTARGLDLHGGAYLVGGVAVDARIYTGGSSPAVSEANAMSTTHVRWDHLRGDGLAVDARGAAGSARRGETVVWDVDVLRGARGLTSTTDLDAAARPFDRAGAQTAWRDGGWTVASELRSASLRGGDLLALDAYGPIASARRGAALGGVGAYDTVIEGGALQSPARAMLTFARAEGGGLLATRLGPFGGTVALRGVSDVASNGEARGADAAGSLRAALSLPLARGFASPDDGDPWVHRVAPAVEVALLGSRASGVFGEQASDIFARGGAAEGSFGHAWLADAKLASAVGRWGSRAAGELDFASGVAGDGATAVPLVRARAALSHTWFGLAGEAAEVLAVGSGLSTGRGNAFVARARVGQESSFNATVNAGARVGVDPALARVLTDAPLEPSSGFLLTEGWTGGARVTLPWAARFSTRGGADADLTTGRLVAATVAAEIHDPCGCIVLRASVAHRIGREGVDVWITADLPRVAVP